MDGFLHNIAWSLSKVWGVLVFWLEITLHWCSEVLFWEHFLSPQQEEAVLLRRPLGKLPHFPNLKASETLSFVSVLSLSAAQQACFTLIYVFPLLVCSCDYDVFSWLGGVQTQVDNRRDLSSDTKLGQPLSWAVLHSLPCLQKTQKYSRHWSDVSQRLIYPTEQNVNTLVKVN